MDDNPIEVTRNTCTVSCKEVREKNFNPHTRPDAIIGVSSLINTGFKGVGNILARRYCCLYLETQEN